MMSNDGRSSLGGGRCLCVEMGRFEIGFKSLVWRDGLTARDGRMMKLINTRECEMQHSANCSMSKTSTSFTLTSEPLFRKTPHSNQGGGTLSSRRTLSN